MNLANLILRTAEKYLGCKEDKNTKNQSQCVNVFHRTVSGAVSTDAWCAKYVFHVMKEAFELAGIAYEKYKDLETASTKVMLARAKKAGIRVDKKPAPGAIMFMPREGGGHVEFVFSLYGTKEILDIGGNVDDQVALVARPILNTMEFIHVEELGEFDYSSLLTKSNAVWAGLSVLTLGFTFYQISKEIKRA